MANKIIMTNEEYNSVLHMLQSEDQENVVIGLTTIDNLDFKSNLTKILMLKKLANIPFPMWEAHASKIYKKLTNLKLDPASTLTYKAVLNCLVTTKQPEEDIQFFLDNFSNHLFNSIKELGFDFIENTEITIKLKRNDKQNRIISESIQESNA